MPKEFISEEVFARGPWHYFERAIARYFVHKGWDDVDHIGKTGDMGDDSLSYILKLLPSKERIGLYQTSD